MTEKISMYGESPFGINRKYRRALFSTVRKGQANHQEVERFKSLGGDAYPWLESKKIIKNMIKKSLKNKKR